MKPIVHLGISPKVEIHAADSARAFLYHILPAGELKAFAGLGLHKGGDVLERHIHIAVHGILAHCLCQPSHSGHNAYAVIRSACVSIDRIGTHNHRYHRVVKLVSGRSLGLFQIITGVGAVGPNHLGLSLALIPAG